MLKNRIILTALCLCFSNIAINAKSALLIVDMQNCFMDDGSLPVKGAYSIVEEINNISKKFDTVIATKDWHPANHQSFASVHGKKPYVDSIELNGLKQTLWPDHCVQNTKGAELVSGLTAKIDYVQLKGQDPQREFYSGFTDTTGEVETELKQYLESQDIDKLYVVGVATDFCVKSNALDANKLGIKTFVIEDLTKAAIDFDSAIDELKSKGVEVINSSDL